MDLTQLTMFASKNVICFSREHSLQACVVGLWFTRKNLKFFYVNITLVFGWLFWFMERSPNALRTFVMWESVYNISV